MTTVSHTIPLVDSRAWDAAPNTVRFYNEGGRVRVVIDAPWLSLDEAEHMADSLTVFVRQLRRERSSDQHVSVSPEHRIAEDK